MAKPVVRGPTNFRNEASLAIALGFYATFVDDVPFAGGPGIRFENQARFHPRKYLAGLASAARAKGVRIFSSRAASRSSPQ